MNEAERDAFLEAQLPLVKRVFSRLRIGLPPLAAEQLMDDLLSAGTLGLIQACDNYDGRAEATFSTFASHRIRGAMLDELRRQDWLSKGSRKRLKEIQRAWSVVEQKLGRAASDDEVALALGVNTATLREELVELGPSTLVFLEGLSKNAEGSDWKSFIADPKAQNPEDRASFVQVAARLSEAVGQLPEQERRVLQLLLEEELGQNEIAEVLEVSPSRISQIYSRAVLRLQATLLPLFD